MQKIEPLTYGNYYHIYNRGINGINLFYSHINYKQFLLLYEKYMVLLNKYRLLRSFLSRNDV